MLPSPSILSEAGSGCRVQVKTVSGLALDSSSSAGASVSPLLGFRAGKVPTIAKEKIEHSNEGAPGCWARCAVDSPTNGSYILELRYIHQASNTASVEPTYEITKFLILSELRDTTLPLGFPKQLAFGPKNAISFRLSCRGAGVQSV